MHTILTVKRTSPKLTRDQWEKIAIQLFGDVYDAQMTRILKVIRRASAETIQELLSRQYYVEPAIVKAAVQKFYDDIVLSGGEAALLDYDLYASWDDVQESLFRLSRARAGWFARAMTETSQRQAQIVVMDWLQTEAGTVAQLREQMAAVWTGPRPSAAATTETTYLFSESRFTTWQQAGVWGYGINTRNDSRVRSTHQEAAANGPYPLSDTQHRPPIYGDVNCRCTPYPVREEPK